MDEFLKLLERLRQTEWQTKWGYSVFAITLLLLGHYEAVTEKLKNEDPIVLFLSPVAVSQIGALVFWLAAKNSGHKDGIPIR